MSNTFRGLQGSVVYLNSNLKRVHPPKPTAKESLAALKDLISLDYDLQEVKTETLETLQEIRVSMEEEAYKEHVERIEAEYDLESHVNDLQKPAPNVWDGQHDAVRERLRS